jgi:hypothetical protein
LIRGHNGSFVFGNGEEFTGFDFVPERPQVTRDKKLKAERIDLPTVGIPLEKDHQGHFKPDTTKIHFKNWLDAVRAGDPKKCNNPPDLGAAAIVLVTLGARSYREGKAFHFDAENLSVLDGDTSWAKNWEMMSKQRSKPNQIPGWTAGDKGSHLEEPSYMTLAGPWKNGEPPVNHRG